MTRTHRKHHYFKLEVRDHFLEGMTFIPRPGRGAEVVSGCQELIRRETATAQWIKSKRWTIFQAKKSL